MASNNIRTSATVRENWFGNCTITKTKLIDKLKHVEMNRKTAKRNELTKVKWKDNKSVDVALNCDSGEPMSTVKTWNKYTQAKPFLIAQYNKGMGTKDRAN